MARGAVPAALRAVREKVLEGKFHPIGGSWVENDANMPSGEALARQLVYGQRYVQSCFGSRSRVAWLPDSFSLTGALPQIIRGVTVSTLGLIPQGETGGMVIFEGHPNYWDAWGASCSAHILLCRVCCS